MEKHCCISFPPGRQAGREGEWMAERQARREGRMDGKVRMQEEGWRRIAQTQIQER